MTPVVLSPLFVETTPCGMPPDTHTCQTTCDTVYTTPASQSVSQAGRDNGEVSMSKVGLVVVHTPDEFCLGAIRGEPNRWCMRLRAECKTLWRSPDESSPFGTTQVDVLQTLEDLVPGVYETSVAMQAELSLFWTTKMAEGWPLIKKNFSTLEPMLKTTKDDSHFNFEVAEQAINLVGRKLALLDTRIWN